MSLINCLRLSDSHEDLGDGTSWDDAQVQYKKRPNFKMYLKRVERSWSGNLTPNFKYNKTNFRKMRSRSNLGIITDSTKSKISPSPPLHWIHKRGSGSEAVFDSAPVTPRLVRCSGMRRDWSFEDLRRALEG